MALGFSNPTDIGGFIGATPTVENKINLSNPATRLRNPSSS